MQVFYPTGKRSSRVIQGCMRISQCSTQQLDELIRSDLDGGIDFFDHADIYGGGECEEKFGDFLKENPSKRAEMLIQTKCGIKRGAYDFSKKHIISSVEGSLKRLKTDYIDFLLLHRPDTLCEPEEVAEAFSALKSSGKVQGFGVSNHNPMQIELLSRALGENNIVFNQLQLSMTETGMIDAGLNVNMKNAPSINRDGGILDYCRLKDITIQPWSPFQKGFFGGSYIGSEEYPELNSELSKIADKYQITPTGVVIAWILRHPAKMQPVVGSASPSRMREIIAASDIVITRDEWYSLYLAAGNKLP